jgi:seryl-tRNA synthetase
MQNVKIIELKNENKEFKNEINELKNENKEFKNKINILENKNLINKIFEAIQDINSINNFENNIEYPINDYLKILRNNRNNHCHYIKKNDNDNIKNIKINKLLNYLLNLSDESKENIN